MRSFISKIKLTNEKSGTRISVCRFLTVKGPGLSGETLDGSAVELSFSEFERGDVRQENDFSGDKK